MPRAYRFDGEPEVGLDFADETDCSYLHPHASVCEEWVVADAHREGMCVNAWGVGDRETATTLAERGVDGIVADCTEVLPRVEQ
ncbi:glycerophosphodiester phosphodiesterase [Halosegnis marinus]|uniref:glycerophosphodiester phosphodiesterase n=1 Tax=Halosegnis marinus TaxID=3034023 RepID=UPI00361F4ABB